MTEPRDPDIAACEGLRLIGPDPQNWVPDRPGIDHNVVVVGGGQSGCAFAFALRRAGIGKVSVIDGAEDEARAGVWLNAARMNVLRTPKTVPGPELGIPALRFQAWYEAREGRAAYERLERIPREARPPIPVLAPAANTSKRPRERPRICATSTSTTRPVSSASAGPKATCRACGAVSPQLSPGSAAICSCPISTCTAAA